MGERQTILQKYFIEGWGKKKIAREMKISRNTVKRYVSEFASQREAIIAGGDKYAIIEAMQEKPKYDTSRRKKIVITEEVIDLVKKCLSENERKRATGKQKLCQNSADIHRDLEKGGYKISYPSVANLVRKLSNKGKEAFIKQVYIPGEVCEFDWGDVLLTINAKEIKYKMAVFTLAARNIRYAYLYRKEDTQCFVDSHIKAYAFFEGVPHLMVYDNMRVAIAKFVGKYEKEPTLALSQMSTYYGFSFRFCNIRKGNEKGHVEKSVDFVRRMAFSSKDIFDTEGEAIERLLQTINELNADKEAFEEERAGMLPKLPDYSSAKRRTGLIDKWSTVVSDTNHYSVPDYLVGKEVELYLHIEKIIVKYEGKEVARHRRSYDKKQFHLNIGHYRRTLKRKPGALSNSLCLSQSSRELQEIFEKFFKAKPKEFISILENFEDYKIDQIKQACESLNEVGAGINCEAIRMILMNKESESIIQGNEANEIEKACLRELSLFHVRGHAI